MSAAISPDTESRLWLPRSALGACVRAILTRSTLAAPLSVAQRHNHLPATPLCSLTWWFEGSAHLLAPGCLAITQAPQEAPLPRLLWAGPLSRPVTSWNPGPVQSLTLLLAPDAMLHLIGLNASDWVNRWCDAGEVLPPDWLAMGAALFEPANAATRVARLQDFLVPRWQAARPTLPLQAQRYLDWARALALHAATSGPGRSLRQIERRIKRQAGLPMRELRGIGRAEQLFFQAQAALAQGHPNWAELADASGYADQSHLCRETRRITGFSPDELYRRIIGDESFWSYRLWQ